MTAPLPQATPPVGDPAPAQPPAADPGSALITQDTLSRLLAREKDQGSRAGVKKLVTDLGFADVAALQTWVEAQRTAQQAALTEVERREQAAAQREQEAIQREQEALDRLNQAVRHAALSRLGATGQNLDDAIRLLAVPDDADQQAVADAAAALAQRRPELFAQAAPVTPPPAPSGSPAGGLPPRGQTPTAGSAGLDMARRRGYITT
ncbi:hypothetical protein [Kitasatospora cheerisanensis]|uniref:Uncharacterized protein n=1 Tax=Kitasatospora cheerisanensis KCTC 2395 TaxID=1348663 RepID=A0A066Z5J5_9ACTN|nr:hypothetical protein [Kitasatospora cheerisanensis]KDN85596.1 hypothetical protein KCH_26130 [Kitasatospora cheerisanensis KCTC 2395]